MFPAIINIAVFTQYQPNELEKLATTEKKMCQNKCHMFWQELQQQQTLEILQITIDNIWETSVFEILHALENPRKYFQLGAVAGDRSLIHAKLS